MGAYYELAQIYRDNGIDAEVDHIVPLQGRRVSGFHCHDNLQLITSLVNKAKSNNFAL
jgi:hypothetical protein